MVRTTSFRPIPSRTAHPPLIPDLERHQVPDLPGADGRTAVEAVHGTCDVFWSEDSLPGQTMLGQMVNITACPRCHGEGALIETPCETCHGEGRLERKRKLRVTIPPGIDEGHQIRLSNEGEAGPRGGPKGSLYVAVSVQPHPALTRDGTELFHELEVSIAQAALGTRVTIPTVEGPEEIEIKAGTQPGAEIRLRGRGVPHLRRPGNRGDLHVMVQVVVPGRLSRRQRELLEAYAEDSGETVSDSGHGGILERVRDALG